MVSHLLRGPQLESIGPSKNSGAISRVEILGVLMPPDVVVATDMAPGCYMATKQPSQATEPFKVPFNTWIWCPNRCCHNLPARGCIPNSSESSSCFLDSWPEPECWHLAQRNRGLGRRRGVTLRFRIPMESQWSGSRMREQKCVSD